MQHLEVSFLFNHPEETDVFFCVDHQVLVVLVSTEFAYEGVSVQESLHLLYLGLFHLA